MFCPTERRKIMEFFPQIKKIIDTPNIAEKWKQFQPLYSKKGEIDPNELTPVQCWERPSYSHFCQIVPPTQLPRRRWGSREKRGALLHSLLHIEATAIDLALDAVYRFREMPLEFYGDWLETAREEFRHYFLIETLLEELGYKYGDFPVHDSLFQSAQKTQDLLSRMAIIPRWYEASGLDANHRILNKLRKFDDPFTRRVVEVLELILEEEIPHVRRGDRWFKWEAHRRKVDPVEAYFRLVESFFSSLPRRDLNVEARLKAGFSCGELKRLSGQGDIC
jgi:uncharacterized ferritin-like protein (DUF455 family)